MLLLKEFTKKWIGYRILKTGIAVFFTALICQALNLPVVFAVITAIVTLEPTASDSIKKGLIRLPASAIGAALAVLFVSLLGNSPWTFALAATLTIYICQKLKLEQGTLVAALTAVAMIPGVHDHFFLAFLIRLSTTTIGLTVSTLVNIFILPPQYVDTVSLRMKNHINEFSTQLKNTVEDLTSISEENRKSPLSKYKIFRKNIDKSEELIQFQESEWKYHRFRFSQYRTLKKLKKQINILQKAVLHLGNLQYINTRVEFTKYEQELITDLIENMTYIFSHLEEPISDDYFHIIYEMDKYLKYEYSAAQARDLDYFHHFQAKLIVFYELLSIHDSLEEMQQLTFSNNTKKK